MHYVFFLSSLGFSLFLLFILVYNYIKLQDAAVFGLVKVERKKTIYFFFYLSTCLVETESILFVFYTRVWDTRNMQPAFTFPAQQYFQVY